jgi:hypothetical protein
MAISDGLAIGFVERVGFVARIKKKARMLL